MTAFRELTYEVAIDMHNRGLGQFSVSNPDNRTIFVGEMPQDIQEGITLLDVQSPSPQQYIDTEYLIIDFWARSAHSDRSKALLRQVYNLYNRRNHWTTDNWKVYWSRALGGIVDGDREQENGKLYRLSIQFLCRNLTNVS